MKLRRALTLPVTIALCLAVAFALGSIGTATASAINAHTVKKIAGKVVAKKASSLNVASANNANLLAGQPAAAYQDNDTVYSVVVVTPSNNHFVVIPLAPGTYEVTWNVWMVGASGTSECYVRQHPVTGTDIAAIDESSNGNNPAFSATGVLKVSAGDTVTLTCLSSTPWATLNTSPLEPIQIVVAPVDSSVAATLTATRGGAIGSKG